MKKIILYSSITYMIIIISLVIFNILSQPTKINFSSYDYYDNEIKVIEEKVAGLRVNDCSNSIKKLIKNSKDTYFVGSVYIKDVYNKVSTSESWLSLYGEAKTACNVDNNDMDMLAITASIQYEELIDKYRFNYELLIADIENRLLLEPALINMENRSRKNLEIKVIEFLIEEGKKYE